jgi:hypothetical protein
MTSQSFYGGDMSLNSTCGASESTSATCCSAVLWEGSHHSHKCTQALGELSAC